MDFKAAVDLIIKELQITGELIDDFKNYPGVPPIQVELAKSKCNNISRLLELLIELKKSENIIHEPVKSAPEKVVKKEEIKENKETQPKITDKVINEPSETIEETRIITKTTIGDSFGGQTGRLNEQLGSRRKGEDVTGKLRSKPVSNLSDVIGTNDKFLFIREIFKGSAETYNKAINDLNASADFSEAHSKLMNYTGGTYEGEAINELLSLLKRKFPSDE